jgi:cysteine desulfurase
VALGPRIYLDHAATTPILPEAAAAIAAACATWANPSSAHREGRAAYAAMEKARARIAAALGWTGTLVFTSGATEALEIALTRARAGPRIVSAIEHPAVLRLVPDARRIAVNGDGTLDLADLDEALAGAALVAVQSVNNETGVIHPIADIAARVKAAGGLLLVDCAQSAGKRPLPDADFLVVAAHKLGGPPGIGALLIRDPATLAAVGGQEGGHRPGTAAVPMIMGFAAALEADHGWYEEARRLRARLDDEIGAAGGEIVAAAAPRIATIGCYRMPGVPAAAQMMQLDLAGIAVSAGSACSSGSLKTSHVLTAMGMSEAAARETIRVSFGPTTTEADVEALLAEWRKLAQRRDHLSRLPGDDAGRARGRGSDAAVARGQVRQPAQPAQIGPRGGRGDRSGKGAGGGSARHWRQSLFHRGRDRGGELGAEGERRPPDRDPRDRACLRPRLGRMAGGAGP